MQSINKRKGVATSGIIGIIAILAIIGIGYFAFRSPAEPEPEPVDGEMMDKDGEAMMDKDGEGAMMDKNGEGAMMEYTGSLLAGSKAKAPLYDFAKADYDKAVAGDKLVVLYFYANWCPICKEEVPKLYNAFNELDTDRVVGFRVNYKDDETDANEVALARQFGVAYQHTKIFVKNGERSLKATESWDKAKYFSEINGAL